MKYSISIDRKQYEVEVGAISHGVAQVSVNGAPYEVHVETQGGSIAPAAVSAVEPLSRPAAQPPARCLAPTPAGAGTIAAPIPGMIIEINVKVGDAVKAGDVVVVMEAMKMENCLITTVDGTVREIRVQKSNQVATGDVIMIIG